MKKSLVILFTFYGFASIAQSNSGEQLNPETNASILSNSEWALELWIPISLAVFTFFIKSIYDAYKGYRGRKRERISSQLETFYWPILTRLEHNNAIWALILNKNGEENQTKKVIGSYVEENIVLKNHQEIMVVIIQHRQHATYDEDLNKCIDAYFLHVSIYEGLMAAGRLNDLFPAFIGAPYPKEFDDLIRNKTIENQQILDKLMI